MTHHQRWRTRIGQISETIKVMQLKFFATYRQITGCKICSIPAPDDVLALLHEATQRWPGFSGLLFNEDGTNKSDDVIIMVNGRHIEHLDGVHTRLSDEDTVAITPVVAGG